MTNEARRNASTAKPGPETPDASASVLAAASPAAQTFRLYVSATSPISSRAIVNVRRFLDEMLPGRHRLAVLNIAEHVEAARADQVVASPTLLRTSPLPVRRFIGDLSDVARLRLALDLPATPSTAGPSRTR